MDIETIRNYCLSLPEAEEYFPFDETTLAFRIMGKIFAMIDLENTEWFVLKCDPDYAIELRDAYPEITPAWHMNKVHWCKIDVNKIKPDILDAIIKRSFSVTAPKAKTKRKSHLDTIL